MSEEEKKAIEQLKHNADSMTSDILGIQRKTLKMLVNLIEKQQKEIEQLKEITQNYNAIGGETFGDDRIIVCSMKYFDDGYFKKNYITKNKIKEILKNLEDYYTIDSQYYSDLELYYVLRSYIGQFKRVVNELLKE